MPTGYRDVYDDSRQFWITFFGQVVQHRLSIGEVIQNLPVQKFVLEKLIFMADPTKKSDPKVIFNIVYKQGDKT